MTCTNDLSNADLSPESGPSWARPKPDHGILKPLAIEAITIDAGLQMRAAIDKEVVEEYAEAMRNGADFPPPIIFYDGKQYWPGDGWHCCLAALRAGMSELSCEIRRGDRRDAILFAAGANAAHGLRRSNADKRRAVEVLLNDAEWCRWSNHEIARVCRVSHQLVGKLRTETGRETSERLYLSKHGRVTTMATERIGKNGQGERSSAEVSEEAGSNGAQGEATEPMRGESSPLDLEGTESDPPPKPLTKKEEKARHQAVVQADKQELAYVEAEAEDLLRDIAAIIFDAPQEKRDSIIHRIDQWVGWGVCIGDLEVIMRKQRPDLFPWDQDDAVDAEASACSSTEGRVHGPDLTVAMSAEDRFSAGLTNKPLSAPCGCHGHQTGLFNN
jgi:hypothetical protein